jgi:hypothetical protein
VGKTLGRHFAGDPIVLSREERAGVRAGGSLRA